MFIPAFLTSCTPVSLYMLKSSSAHTLSYLFMYCSFASIGHADILWSIVSSVIIIIIIIIIQYICLLSQAFLPGTSLEPAVIPTAQASSFTLQYFPYCV